MLGQQWSKYIQQKMWDLHKSSQKFYEDQSNSLLTSLSMGIWGSYKINCNTHSSHYEEVVYKVVEDRPALAIFYLSAQETLNQRDSCCVPVVVTLMAEAATVEDSDVKFRC